MLGAGTLGFPLRRFLGAEALGASLWATVQTGVGYTGGRLVEGTLPALALSVGVALAVGVLIERLDALRRRRRRRRRQEPSPPGPGEGHISNRPSGSGPSRARPR